ncbi:purine-cytosine permease family protein [Virgibacillus alimentarius]|uniref:Cytosine permease n=1 Tax=Virgibacillus alimentarius TaxID=698769 RepID=A0ABS4SDS2_9BACI|nr:cytosine permease [Virgibacillus alimentarius]MBP2259145.1 cytosine permease [Virgibacillus alimentarius]
MNKSNMAQKEKDYSTKPVPLKNRKSWVSVAAIYFGMTAAISSFATGGGLIVNLPFRDSLLSLLIATGILMLIFYVPLGLIGAREGLNTYIIGESAFGSKGTNIATGMVISVIPAFGWYGIQVSIAAEALNQSFGGQTSLTPLFMVILGILFVIPALFGITSMALLDYISIPAILIITILGVLKVFSIFDLNEIFSYQPEGDHSLLWGINLVIGGLVAGCCFVPDYTRWTKRKLSDVSYSGLVGIGVPLILLTIVGSMMALTATSLGIEEAWDISKVLAALGLPSIALLLIIVLQWTTNIVAAYSAGLALNKAFGWSRIWWTLIVAIVGTSLSLFGIISSFLGFLNFLSIFISPVAGVLICEYFIISKGKLNSKRGFYWPGIIAWLIGGLSAYLIPYFIPALNGFFISMILYFSYHRFIIKKEDKEISVNIN